MAARLTRLPNSLRLMGVRFMSSEYGSGSGKGGGSGGTIRDAGGSFGKMEAAHEEQYFRRLQAEQLKKMKEHLGEEIDHHERSIKQHKESIERHKKKIGELKHEETKNKKD